MADRIVSIGFLTDEDLRRLGEGFTRHFPVVDDDLFADLLDRLNQLPAVDIRRKETSGAPSR
ncbi:MAG: hypothetical protein QHC40_00750 [Sphingobium sp.]|nr:hypothetical protein [Sphingobium sp.]